MPLFACGINHQTASLAVREQLVFAQKDLHQHLQALIQVPKVREVAILSTCNRTEFYGEAEKTRKIVEWLKAQHPLQFGLWENSLYIYQEEAAVRHMMRVACGLDSMVLGEPQILGQMKSAFMAACEAGTVGNRLQRLFQQVFAVTKRVRTATAIGTSPVSIAYAAVDLARRIFAHLEDCTVLLIGAGETIELAARHFSDQKVRQLFFANRTLAKAAQLAKKWNGQPLPLTKMAESLAIADIVVSATASMLPILGKGSVETALRARKRRPMLMLDIAVPRDIEPEVGNLPDIYLYTVDDLQGVIEENIKSRKDAAKQAEKIIDFEVVHYMNTLRSLESVPTICAYREKSEGIRDEELAKAMSDLNKGIMPQEVIKNLARALTNKLMHTPTAKLRQAAYEGQVEMLLFARQLFDIKE